MGFIRSAEGTRMGLLRATVCKETARETMKDAADELHKNADIPPESVIDIGVSNDGAWSRRGFASINGLVATLSMESRRVLDVEPMSRLCRMCKDHESLEKEDPVAFTIWKENHESVCKANFSGSACAMEVTGTKRIFNRSKKDLNLRYQYLYSDGDSKSFSAIENTYNIDDQDNPIKVEKKECVGHVQKRVGSRCAKLKKTVRGLGGKGKLTGRSLQNYYGANKRNVAAMKRQFMQASFTVHHHQTCGMIIVQKAVTVGVVINETKRWAQTSTNQEKK